MVILMYLCFSLLEHWFTFILMPFLFLPILYFSNNFSRVCEAICGIVEFNQELIERVVIRNDYGH